jgi:hypothetical protein
MFRMNESGTSVGTEQVLALRVSAASRDLIAAAAPVRELLLVEAVGHARVPTAACRPDHRARQGQWVASVLRDNPEGSVGSRDSKGRCRGAARDTIEAGLN